jgi:hypothetical protein
LIPVLLKGLSATQAERYQSAREFVQDLKEVLPKLKATSSSSADDATAVALKPSQQTAIPESPQQYRLMQTNPGELDSMTSLLVDYVGPIAKNIMVAYDRENTSVSELVTSISKEIPEPGEREEFLKRWEEISGTRIETSRNSDAEATGGSSEARSFDDDLLKRMGEDYAGYIGPLAARLVQHHAATSGSLEQLVELLASEIPNAKDSEKFRTQWRHG